MKGALEVNSAWYTVALIQASLSVVATKNCWARLMHHMMDSSPKSKISCWIIGRSAHIFSIAGKQGQHHQGYKLVREPRKGEGVVVCGGFFSRLVVSLSRKEEGRKEGKETPSLFWGMAGSDESEYPFAQKKHSNSNPKPAGSGGGSNGQ